MGHHKRTDASKGNTMEQYTTPVPLPQRVGRSEVSGDDMRAPQNPEEPSHSELLAAIQGSRVALEGKIETVAVKVNLLQADLRKVSDKVKVAEGSIVELQTEVGALGKQMVQATSTLDGWRREEVWRWLEMWDKVAEGRTEGPGGVIHRASGAESPDWRLRDAGRLVDAGTGGSAMDSHYRVEIQQDGIMAMMAADLVGDTALERGMGTGGDPAVA
ncbi:hypothetical protein NDU88_003264 [Pleurodeles waltl]|uniref:Uncharacterized protein n=1 Tax=Pleurodeles waltl TaxID=8319 RepID=A0AAV7QF76_PLEWA|nr:hypothetical protein NDU88_003264 [Pleurodeles waltl]